MKHLYLILGIFLISENISAQNEQQIKLLATELHTDYYTERTYPKDLFTNHVVSDSLFSIFPDIIRSFEFSPDDNLKLYTATCDLRVKKIEKEYKKGKEFSNFWKENLKACYGKYVQSSPEIRFAFELQSNTTIYHINEVSAYVYHAKIPLSTDRDYFNHKKDERERLIIDITKIGQEQILQLNQAHAVKDGGLALNLRLFSSEHWNGSFERVKVLLHINFKFTNGQVIRSEPFMVEM
ncbi:hypothetical protein [Aquimarina spinulae]|uniref:hypothetical protein n=1 Tax=Aquimarina spinulae TaxID=1192023 RepID=UPI000D557A8A|nr:hypothetical protein [Aquimarina spinulae]